MFISKKAFNNMLDFLEQGRKTNAEIAGLVNKLKKEIDAKEELIAEYRKIIFRSKWITVNCPQCNHKIDVHSMEEVK